MPVLDHIFILVPGEHTPLRHALESDLGLRETYRRRHPGQGTTNICYAFDNAFVELLWIVDADECRSPTTRRLGFLERTTRCPFGIAYRCPEQPPPLETWDYRPSYLPPGMSIPIAVISDDPAVPMVFESPGRSAPIDWPPERRADLQHAAGFTRVEATLGHPGLPDLGPIEGLATSATESLLTLHFLRADGGREDLIVGPRTHADLPQQA